MKRDRHSKIQWGRVLRRGTALLMVTAALWALLTAAGAGAAAGALRALGEDGGFVSAVLRAELGAVEGTGGPFDALDRWGQLVVGQSALLRSNEGAVARWLDGGADRDGAESEAPEQEAEPADPPEAEDPEAPANLPAVTAAPDDIIPRTLVPSSDSGYTRADDVYIYNTTGVEMDGAALAAAPVDITLGDPAQPQILIMHTHATEAYTPDGTDVYEPTDPYRTLDTNYNMVRVGEEMAAVLEEAGFSVYHDTTLYDYPSYNDAYDRSYEGVQALLEQYPTIQVVLDVHRDALEGTDGTVYKTMAQLEGERSAQVMLVMGSDDNGLSHEHWRENLALAVRLQLRLNEDWPTLARPISLRSGRYNQQLSLGSVLVEVGSHGNSLQEALQAARLFAQSAAQVLSGLVQAQ